MCVFIEIFSCKWNVFNDTINKLMIKCSDTSSKCKIPVSPFQIGRMNDFTFMNSSLFHSILISGMSEFSLVLRFFAIAYNVWVNYIKPQYFLRRTLFGCLECWITILNKNEIEKKNTSGITTFQIHKRIGCKQVINMIDLKCLEVIITLFHSFPSYLFLCLSFGFSSSTLSSLSLCFPFSWSSAFHLLGDYTKSDEIILLNEDATKVINPTQGLKWAFITLTSMFYKH